MSPVRIEVATVADADALLAVIKRAFTAVAEQYGDHSLPPLLESAEAFRSRFSDHVVLKALDGDRIVGTVLGVMEDDSCLVGRLAVEPESQGRGIGRALASAIEERFPNARRFELFTGHLSAETLGLYASLGYAEFRRAEASERVTLVFLEKTRG